MERVGVKGPRSIYITFEPDVHRELMRLKFQEDKTPSRVINRAIRSYLGMPDLPMPERRGRKPSK